LKAEDIDTVILSHYHGDHISNAVRLASGVFRSKKSMVPAVGMLSGWTTWRWRCLRCHEGAFQNVRKVLASALVD
jgi:L-ascorbate metabolism protein UlaG (beta-lactamase superfamily)